MDNKTLCIKSTESSSGVYYEVPIDLPPLGVGGAGTVRKGFQINEKTGVRKEVAIKFLFDDLPESAIIRSEKEANIRIVHENLVEMIDFVKVADKTDDIYGKSKTGQNQRAGAQIKGRRSEPGRKRRTAAACAWPNAVRGGSASAAPRFPALCPCLAR